MPTVSFDDVLGLDDEFDPLMADDLEIDQEDMDDDNPLDTVDYPTMRNMPQSMQREAVYTPKRQGGVESWGCAAAGARRAAWPSTWKRRRPATARCTRP